MKKINLQGLKKKIALYMALIMVFGLIVPFAMPSLTVLAIDPVWDNVGARGGDLQATFHGTLSAVPGQDFPHLHRVAGGNPIVAEGSVMLNWAVTPGIPGQQGMYVLRFFDSAGRRNELTVRHIQGLVEGGPPTGGLMVNFDIYMRRYVTGGGVPVPTGYLGPTYFAGYINIGDPMRDPTESGHFHIYVPVLDTFESARDYFGNGRNPDEPSGLLPGLNRINDRVRFVTPGALYSPLTYPHFTSHHPNYPNTPNNLRGPLEDPYSLDMLTPSFNIAPGGGYSFSYGGRTFHFLWVPSTASNVPYQFYFFIEDILSPGSIYEFHLEYYSAAHATRYFTENVANYRVSSPPGHPTLIVPPVTGRGGTVYVFTGIDAGTINAIPFAQNLVERPPGSGLWELVDHTITARLAGEYESVAPALFNPPVGAEFPVYNTANLNMTIRPPQMLPYPDDSTPFGPGTPSVGLDIRFNLPTLFDEETGQFVEPIRGHSTLRDTLQVRLIANVGDSAGVTESPAEIPTTEDFIVEFQLGDVDNFTETDDPPPGTILAEGNYDIELTDVSLLSRRGQTYLSEADRVRVRVDGLRPSMSYDEVFLFMWTGAEDVVTDFLGWPTARVGTHENPFYTFLRFVFTEQLGRPFIRLEPFNYSVGRARSGWYQMHGTPPDGFAPQLLPIGVQQHLYFPLPRMLAGEDRVFWFTKHINNPIDMPSPGFRSQNVIWTPDRTPTIGLPNNFQINNVLSRPVQGDLHAARLTFNASWDIGTVADIVYLLAEPQPLGSSLYIEYMLGLSTMPESQLTNPYHESYMRVVVEIMQGTQTLIEIPATTPGAPPLEFYLPTVRYRGYFYDNDNPDLFGRPVVRHGEWRESELGFRMDPISGESVFFASVDIRTDALRRYRPNWPPFFRDDFWFPGLYYMNVQLNRWTRTDLNDDTSATFEASEAWSLFDYIVIEDTTELDPPPPSHLSVVASTDPEAPPELVVTFGLPMGAIGTYLGTLYEMEVQLWTNLYIGQFEEAIMNTFFSGDAGNTPGMPLSPRYRPSTAGGGRGATIDVPFSTPGLFTFNTAPGYNRFELDLSAYQNILRGIGADRAAVVRITDIPLIWTGATREATTGSALTISRGETVNHFPAANDPAPPPTPNGTVFIGDEAIRDSFYITRERINQGGDHIVTFYLTGVEENRAYFLFADLAIQQFIPLLDDVGEVVPNEWLVRYESPVVSDLTGIVTDTTVGTPQIPGPGEVHPPAPSNLHVYEFDQMSASVRWDPMFLTPEEADYNEYYEPRVRIEWEIIRIQDGPRLTDAQMRDRNPNFSEFLSSLENVPLHLRKGWITSGGALTVLPAGETIYEPNDGIFYGYRPNIVELSDMTLMPNTLYFFYVRTVRIERVWDFQLGDYVEIRTTSTWVEESVTTTPVQPPINLRQEDGSVRYGFDGTTMAFVSWEHEHMVLIREAMRIDPTRFVFQYQIRYGEGEWGEIFDVPARLMINDANLDPFNINRIRYMVTGLTHSSVYQMRVRLVDQTSEDPSRWSHSVWSNVITILTEHDPDDDYGEDDWLEFLRRQLEELLRRPFWFAQNTPTSTIMVYRPAEMFAGLLLGTPGTAIPLHNTDVNDITFYLPASIIEDANAARRGFSTRYSDLDILLAPFFINRDHNQAIMDMVRLLDARGSDISDYFVRLDINRVPMTEIHGVPGIGRQTDIQMTLVATNRNIRNLRSWDLHVLDRAARIVDDVADDPVMRQNMRNLLQAGTSNEDMVAFVDDVVDRTSNRITQMVGGYMTTRQNGILTTTEIPVTDFDAPMHVLPNSADANMSVNGFMLRVGQWVAQPLLDTLDGPAITSRTPGTFAFTGRVVDIPGISDVAQGGEITSIVARFGLENYFGLSIDLQQNANRHMVVGSIARMANAPLGADPMTWAAANLNVQMSSRNATALIPRQEAIAMVMALYELRTNTRVDGIMIRNFQNTAGMTLDPRYAQAVRAAFEVGLVSDSEIDPAGPITIGEFLDMVAAFNNLLPL
ncbi:MAG: hypothetical protein FWB91_01310 [Defluviitaleaceae bacterium]|nr:hypothetical protein [Defluviitaleaceae bacterium]